MATGTIFQSFVDMWSRTRPETIIPERVFNEIIVYVWGVIRGIGSLIDLAYSVAYCSSLS